MANTFLPEQAAGAALGILEREVVLAQFVHRVAEADFRGARDDTVTLRVAAVLEAREYGWRNNRAQPIVLDNLEEIGVDVKLDTDVYSAVGVTDEELTLDITSFGEQVLAPQTRAIASRLEQTIATTIEGAPIAWTVDEADPFKAAAKARAALNKASVPVNNRVLVLGADVETAFLSSPLLVRVDTSGSTAALRDAVVGRIAGFDTYVSQFIDPDVAYAFERDAFAFANMAPVVPDGVAFGRSLTFAGFACRWIRDYDANFLRDRSVVSSFAGCSSVNDGTDAQDGENVRAVKLTGITDSA